MDDGVCRAIPTALWRRLLCRFPNWKSTRRSEPYSAGNATFIPNAIDPDGRRKGSFLSGMAVFQHQVSANTSYRAGYQVVDTRRGYTDGPQGPVLV